MVLIKLDIVSITNAVAKDIVPRMNKLTQDVKKRCEDIAPTDTGTYKK